MEGTTELQRTDQKMWRFVAHLTATTESVEVIGGGVSSLPAGGAIWARLRSPGSLRMFTYGYLGLLVDGLMRTPTDTRFYPAGEPQLMRIETGPQETVSGTFFFVPRRYARRRMREGDPSSVWPVLVEVWMPEGEPDPQATPPGFSDGQNAYSPVDSGGGNSPQPLYTDD
jgi:hypothetical protein